MNRTRPGTFLALISVALALATLPACASPKSGTELGDDFTSTSGLGNSSRVKAVDKDGKASTTQNSGSTPNSSGTIFRPDGTTVVTSAEPGPTDNFGLDSLGFGIKLSNTVTMKKGNFTFALTDDPGGGKSATISGFTFDEFSTSPPATIDALAGFQREWNPAKIAEVQAVKEAWNKAVEEWARTVRETVPELAAQILKTFVVP